VLRRSQAEALDGFLLLLAAVRRGKRTGQSSPRLVISMVRLDLRENVAVRRALPLSVDPYFATGNDVAIASRVPSTEEHPAGWLRHESRMLGKLRQQPRIRGL